MTLVATGMARTGHPQGDQRGYGIPMRRRRTVQGTTVTGTLARLDDACRELDQAVKAFEPAAELEARRQRLADGRPQFASAAR